MANVGVVLSGCGYRDGSEVYETVLALTELDAGGANAKCYAPDIDVDVVDYLSKDSIGTRNVLHESARLVRGDVKDLKLANAAALDALIIPGGFGAALHLSDFAEKGAACSVIPELASLIEDMHALAKPIGAICIAPALVARVLGRHEPKLTIGNDEETAAALQKMGARHRDCSVSDCIFDRDQLLVSTPAYMLATGPAEAAGGIRKLVKAVLDMIS